MGLLTAGVLIFSDSKDIVNMDQISDKTQFFWDPSFSKQTLNDPSFVNKKVLLVVHGYNNTFDYAVKSIKEVNSFINNMKTSDNKPLYDLVIGYIWPGYESFIEYELAVEHADALKERVQAHLLELHHITPHIDVIAHSLGNRVILEALNFESVNKERPFIRNFFALAPAVDASSIEENRPYYNSVKNCENFFVFHSFKDDVLKLLYPLTSGSEALGIEINPNFKKLTSNIL